MAEIVGVIYTSHAWVDTKPGLWSGIRALRHHRDDVPGESVEEQVAKATRMQRAVVTLRSKLDEMRPDVLVFFGDDQHEYFEFDNFPALAIYCGAEFSGRQSSSDAELPPSTHRTVPGHPGLATAMVTGLMERGFDPAFCLTPPDSERGMCHAVMNPLSYFDRFSTPVVPILMNVYYAPQMQARRCAEVGRATRQIIDAYPDDLRIVIVGSGGLWHTPFRDGAYLDEGFDQRGLAFLRVGDVGGWAEFFDAYRTRPDDASQDSSTGRGVTGLPTLGGPQMGTRETCNWIGAAGTVEGRPAVIVDYVPVYASPIGTAFAYCDNLEENQPCARDAASTKHDVKPVEGGIHAEH